MTQRRGVEANATYIEKRKLFLQHFFLGGGGGARITYTYARLKGILFVKALIDKPAFGSVEELSVAHIHNPVDNSM